MTQEHPIIPPPEPEGSTDIEITSILKAYAVIEPQMGVSRILHERHFDNAARAILARLGNHQGMLASSMPQPIPVTERLPGAEDCIANPRNGQGQWCWGWCVDDSAVPFSGRWRMIRRQWLADEAVAWLPAHALPVPS